MAELAEVAAGVFVLRYPVLDVNVTLVVGDEAAMVVDTLSTDAQARELAAAVRRVTPHRWILVNTHHHFDHCFGNATLAAEAGGGCPIWGHEEAAALLRDRADALRRQWYEHYAGTAPDLAAALAAVAVLPPDRTVHLESTVDVGGRPVVLRHLGRAHTAGDLLVHVPDADVLVAGDVVEQGAPPGFEDSYPLEWPDTLAALLRLLGRATTVVPGHGALVDRAFVAEQHAELTSLAWLIREGHAGDSAPETVAASSPFGAPVSLPAVRRGYAELSGRG